MTIRTFALSLALAAAFAAPSLAAAATVRVDAVKGDVRVAGASGLASAKSGETLKSGDRIVARTGSVALRYADGCVVTVPTGAMTTIGAASPCAGGAGLINPGSSAALTIPGFGRVEGASGYVALTGVVLLGASLIAAATYSP